MGMLIGFGHSCYGTRGIIGFASDVGYINYIWFCGFIGLILLLVCIIAIFNNRLKCSKLLFEQHMLMMLLITFFVMFIKGNVISHTAGTSLLILILVRSYSTRKNCTERK